jgi:hypothetical protein
VESAVKAGVGFAVKAGYNKEEDPSNNLSQGRENVRLTSALDITTGNVLVKCVVGARDWIPCSIFFDRLSTRSSQPEGKKE